MNLLPAFGFVLAFFRHPLAMTPAVPTVFLHMVWRRHPWRRRRQRLPPWAVGLADNQSLRCSVTSCNRCSSFLLGLLDAGFQRVDGVLQIRLQRVELLLRSPFQVLILIQFRLHVVQHVFISLSFLMISAGFIAATKDYSSKFGFAINNRILQLDNGCLLSSNVAVLLGKLSLQHASSLRFFALPVPRARHVVSNVQAAN